jgi:hypothetical protein
MVCSAHKMLFGRQNQGGCDGLDKWHVGGTLQMQGFDGGDCKERIHLEDQGVDGGMILKHLM